MGSDNGAGELTKFSRAWAGKDKTKYARAQRKTLLPQMRQGYRESRAKSKQSWWERLGEEGRRDFLRNRGLRRTLKRLGVSPDTYERLLIAQDGLCAICQNPEMREGYRLSLDHNHNTGKLRGLLCGACNKRLSAFEDELWTEKALSYLKEHQ